MFKDYLGLRLGPRCQFPFSFTQPLIRSCMCSWDEVESIGQGKLELWFAFVTICITSCITERGEREHGFVLLVGRSRRYGRPQQFSE